MPRTAPRPALGKLRIVGGSLRGSKLAVPDAPGLRPTPDRVRETLFNWLMPVIEGARCLDLFSGTGALGIEALSRGAGAVDFIEADVRVAQAIRDNLSRLRQTCGAVRTADAMSLLRSAPDAAYDIVFVDPPFAAGTWAAIAEALENNGWLRPNALIYVETPTPEQPAMPAQWQPHRESVAGALRYALYRRRNASAKL